LAVAFSVAALSGVALAQGPPPATTGATEPAPQQPAPPAVIPEGVTIQSVAVGGMAPDQAAAAVQEAFGRPLRFVFGRKRWSATPEQLGATAYVESAVQRALIAAPGTDIELSVRVRGRLVREYVAYLDSVFTRPAKDSALRLRRLRPFITESRDGAVVERWKMAAAIVRALRTGNRGPVQLEARIVRPKFTRESFGPVIVIHRESKKLVLFDGMRFWRLFRIATGQASYPTPLGRYEIVVKQRDPWWYPPQSDWAKGQKPVPPGPGNPLGTRWMGISAPLVGIHGTPDAASIGYSASHGCVRMRIPDAEWLFDHVDVGTPVFIVRH
jgi:hypothetical protein